MTSSIQRSNNWNCKIALAYLSTSLLVLVVCIATLYGCQKDATIKTLSVGEQLPNITFSSFDGKQTLSESFEGKTVIINFWASWCAPCRKEMPSLENLHMTLDQNKYAVIGVSVDEDNNLAEEFLLQYKISFPNYHDKSMDISKTTFGVKAFPETFIISPQGKITNRIVGEQIWDSKGMIKLLRGISKGDASSTKSWSYDQ